jgi:hypothetical protein
MLHVRRFACGLGVVVAALALLDGCCIGRSYGAQNHTWVNLMTNEQLAVLRGGRVRAGETVDGETCRRLCGASAVRCAVATIDPALPGKAQKPPASPDERVLVCETYTPGGCDMIPR